MSGMDEGPKAMLSITNPSSSAIYEVVGIRHAAFSPGQRDIMVTRSGPNLRYPDLAPLVRLSDGECTVVIPEEVYNDLDAIAVRSWFEHQKAADRYGPGVSDG